MKRNIFTKSMLRQPVKTVLLALLLAVAAFSFVMRSVEYIVINERITEIGSFYRAIGYLGEADIYGFGDVSPCAEIISASQYIDFDDKRRTVEVSLLDMTNTYTNRVIGRKIDRDYDFPKDAFFLGTLTQVQKSGNDQYIVLSIAVDSVMLGYPERVQEGQTLDVHYFLDSNEIQEGVAAIDGMEVGGRYLMRGVYYDMWVAQESGLHSQYLDMFVMHPLNEATYGLVGDRRIPKNGVWYAPAPPGEPLDLFMPGLEGLNDELTWIEYGQSKLRLQTTVDMSYMPFMQPRSGPRCVLTDGRWVNREDNELSRPVVAIHDTFAEKRGLSVGDTLRIGVPPQEQRNGVRSSICPDGYLYITVEGEVFAPYSHILELEIVGTFLFENAVGMLSEAMATTFIYIPDSVLPDDVILTGYEIKGRINDEIVTITYEDGYFYANWYTFVLDDPKDADAFVMETRDAIEELGFSIEFLPGVAGAKAFWESSETVLQTVSFNVVLFSIVSFIVLVLAVFLYIRQRHRDYAILRALGNPARRTNRQLITTLLLFALPAVAIGGAGGWFVALGESARALEALPNTDSTGISVFWLPALMAAMLAGLFVLMLAGITTRRRPILEMLQGNMANRAKEGAPSKAVGKAAPDGVDAGVIGGIGGVGGIDDAGGVGGAGGIDDAGGVGGTGGWSDEQKLQGSSGNQRGPDNKAGKNSSPFSSFIFHFITRHIFRQRIKTLLAAVIALFFVVALGYLQTAIETTGQEIEDMYNNIIVKGEIKQAIHWNNAPGRLYNNVIRPQTLDNVAPLVRNELVIACHEYVVLTSAKDDGSLPEDWDIIAGINIEANLMDNLHAFNTLVGVNDLERYVRTSSRSIADEFTGFSWEPCEEVSWVADWQAYSYVVFADMQINFAQGFDPGDFVMAEGSPIPIIVSNYIMGSRGLKLGDIIYIGSSTMLRSWTWNHTPAVIVGTHNQLRLTSDIQFGTILPIEALEQIVGDELRLISIQFEIDPVHNREMALVREQLEEITEHMRAGEVALGLFLEDEELRLVVIPMEQNLSLLKLLYPVAIALSAIIGLGLSLLLMLQNARVAAIMRVLGTTKTKSRVTLCAEQVAVCVFGLILGLAALAALGWGYGLVSSLGLAGVYLAAAVAGMIVGAVVVTNKAPLELLQVKE